MCPVCRVSDVPGRGWLVAGGARRGDAKPPPFPTPGTKPPSRNGRPWPPAGFAAPTFAPDAGIRTRTGQNRCRRPHRAATSRANDLFVAILAACGLRRGHIRAGSCIRTRIWPESAPPRASSGHISRERFVRRDLGRVRASPRPHSRRTPVFAHGCGRNLRSRPVSNGHISRPPPPLCGAYTRWREGEESLARCSSNVACGSRADAFPASITANRTATAETVASTAAVR